MVDVSFNSLKTLQLSSLVLSDSKKGRKNYPLGMPVKAKASSFLIGRYFFFLSRIDLKSHWSGNVNVLLWLVRRWEVIIIWFLCFLGLVGGFCLRQIFKQSSVALFFFAGIKCNTGSVHCTTKRLNSRPGEGKPFISPGSILPAVFITPPSPPSANNLLLPPPIE